MIRTYRAGVSSTAPDKSSANALRAKLAAFREARASTAKRAAETKPAPRIDHLHPKVLLEALTDEQKAGLAAKLVVDAPRSKASRAALSQSRSDAGAKASAERAVAVLTHESAHGRMDSAKKLLANNKLSADEIIAILAASGPSDGADAAADMRQVLAEIFARNGASAGAAESNPAKAADIWARAHAKIAAEMGS